MIAQQPHPGGRRGVLALLAGSNDQTGGAVAQAVPQMFFLCETVSHGQPSPVETMEIGWFDIDHLPELSTTWVLDSQIRLLHDHWNKPELPTVYD
ncbi:hypothetical protein [Nocardia asteroides]|uniref:hypothetical protein n=1 Tax=Nocardia asteroides TaxID=1824 RepID=UPI0034154742